MRRAHGLVVILLLIAAWASFAYLALDFGQLFSTEAAAQMLKYVVSFFPPDVSADYLAQTWRGTLETVAISAIGTLLAALLGLLLALPASGRFGIVEFVNLDRPEDPLFWGGEP